MPDRSQEQKFPIRRLFRFIQRGFRSSCTVRRGGLNVQEPAKDTKDLHDYSNPFLKLPNELVLLIADFLDQEFQALLSLSCRRFRVLLASSLDLSLCGRSAKVRFLQHLEIDYPGHLTCRSCALMYNWQTLRWLGFGYRCPAMSSHSHEDRCTSFAWHTQGDQMVSVTREVIDLIFRAHERGQQYGLPLSFLSTSGSGSNGVIRTNGARFVDDQLLLASRWAVDSEPGHDMAEKARLLSSGLCIHSAQNVWLERVWQSLERAVEGVTGSEEPKVSKCPFCATDYKLCVLDGTDGRTTIVLSVWRNYGKRHGNVLENEQMFHLDPSSRIDAEALSRRDLSADWDSYKGGTDSARAC